MEWKITTTQKKQEAIVILYIQADPTRRSHAPILLRTQSLGVRQSAARPISSCNGHLGWHFRSISMRELSPIEAIDCPFETCGIEYRAVRRKTGQEKVC